MLCPKLRQFVIALLLLPLVAAGCSPPTNTATTPQSPTAQTVTSPTRQIRIVATFLPMYLFTQAVAGDAAKVEILIQPGTEVHDYQATPANVKAIAEADVVVKNGLGLEEFLDRTIKSAENPRLKVIDASQGIPALKETAETVSVSNAESPAPGTDRAEEKGKAGEHVHADGNPHVWLSPVLAKRQVETIRDGLMAADPANKATYQANAAVYIQKLSDLNNQFEQSLKPFPDRTFITFHDAFPYLAKQYDLKQVAIVQIPEDQLTPTDVQQTIDVVKRYSVKALFSEPGIDNKLISGLANDLKITVRPLKSLESGQLDPQYYFTAMEENLQTLKTAFQK
jgi:zinc/manganese transport system substrate-binding protein